MTDNISLGPDAQLNHALRVLRTGSMEGEIADEVRVLPGVTLRADPALGAGGRYASPEGRLFDLDVTVSGEGGWLALHMGFPARDLTGFGVIGLACRTAAPEIQVIQPCLRSGTEEGFEDCFFDKHILTQPEESSHVDALPVGHRAQLPVEAPWRELILFLPTRPFRWSLLDLRVFAV